MELFKKIRIFILLLLVSTQALADHPFLTDDPDTLMPHESEILLYSTFFKQIKPPATFIQAPAVEFDFSLAKDTEFDTYFPINTVTNTKGLSANSIGLGDFGIELKYRFVQETKYRPQIAFAPNAFIPTGNLRRGTGNGRPWYYYPIIAQKSLGKWLTYGEIAYATNGAPQCQNYYFAGFVAQRQMSDTFFLGAELFGQTRSTVYLGPFTLLNIGSQYVVNKSITVYSSVGHTLTGVALWSAYFGVGWGQV